MDLMRLAGRSSFSGIALIALICAAALLALPPREANGQWRDITPPGGRVVEIATAPSDPNRAYLISDEVAYRRSAPTEPWLRVNPPRIQEAFLGVSPTSIAVNPANANHVILGTGQGIRESFDGGITWLDRTNVRGAPSGVIEDVEFNSTAVYLADVWNGTVSVSRDSGANFTQPASLPAIGYQSVATSPSDPSVAYARSLDGRVFRTADMGGTWTERTALPENPDQSGWGQHFDVSPVNPNHLVAGGEGFAKVSFNGGATWEALGAHAIGLVFDRKDPSRLYATTLKSFEVISSETADVYHRRDPLPPELTTPWTLHSLPDGRIFLGSSHGLHVSRDGGATWTRDDHGLDSRRFDSIVVNSIDSNIVHGSSFEALNRTTDGGRTWVEALHPTALRVMGNLAQSPFAKETYFSRGSNFRVWRSDDLGETWYGLGSEWGYTNADLISISPSNPNVMYASAWNELSLTVDGGATWSRPGGGSSAGPDSAFQALLIDQMDDRRITAIQNDGKVWRSADRGETWELVSPNFGSPSVRDVAHTRDLSAIYAVGKGVHVSRDGGATWKNIGLDDDLVYQIVVDPLDPLTLYAATAAEPGIWRSVDGGKTWHSMSDGIPSPCCVDLLRMGADGKRMYAATRRAKMYVIDRAALPPPPPPPAPGPRAADEAPAGAPKRPGSGASPAPVSSERVKRTPRPGSRGVRIVGTSKADRLRGTRWADVLIGRGGNDVLHGLRGNDRLIGGPGNDRLIGGPGNDRLIGGPGNDRLVGGPGNDRLVGGPGNDRLVGGAGHDRIITGSGRDRVNAGAGNDVIIVGRGRSVISAGDGNDTIRSRNGARDVIRCGRGRDRVYADRRDVVAKDCEVVIRR